MASFPSCRSKLREQFTAKMGSSSWAKEEINYNKEYHKSTPTELAEELSKNRDEKISPKTLSKKILQNTIELEERSISVVIRKSNGKRLIEIFRNRVIRDDKMSTS